jgi:hypothetical protein
MIYFVPEAEEHYAQAGLTHPRSGYFASRAAALGAVSPEVVVATFFNFQPDLVRAAMAGVWDLVTPAVMVQARLQAADAALRRAWPAEVLASAELADAAALARRAAEAACEHPEGRPLFAGHAALPWPEEAHLVLWHAQTLLREFRGDGHLAALLAEDVNGIEALVVHAATGEAPADFLRLSRAWPTADWDAAVGRLRDRGWLTLDAEPTLTDAGAAHRRRVEDRTDELAVAAYRPLGSDACERLRSLARPLSRAVVDAGLLVPDLSRLQPEP